MSSGSRRGRWRRALAVVAVALTALLSSGCVGQLGRNDDHVGPTSLRPDARPRS